MRALMLAAILMLGLTPLIALAQDKAAPGTAAQIDYQGFQGLADEVNGYRAERLAPLADFQLMAREPNTIILDARSADAYAAGHIAGAINLPFTDFTDQSLRTAIGDPNTRILIYCNNNFSNNSAPVVLKRVELALNIQTFINLYGYGYRNIYELSDVVDFNDPAVGWVRS
ncbi:MAG: rhodanese-like domain-containing protein [Terricaulis sp.]|jgi:rhodanese-related sulfurtransferase